MRASVVAGEAEASLGAACPPDAPHAIAGGYDLGVGWRKVIVGTSRAYGGPSGEEGWNVYVFNGNAAGTQTAVQVDVCCVSD